MEPGSQLVRGLVDNPSGGLSPALDRSTTFDHEPGGSSPYGRGHAPVAAEAEALLGALEDAEATVFASGMTAWTCICLTRPAARAARWRSPTSGYYSLDGFASGILERFGVELRRYDARDRDALPPRLRRRCARDHRDAVQSAADAHGHRAGGRRRACRRRAAVLRQHVRDAAPAAPARPRRRPRLAERDEVPRGHSDVLAGVITTRDPSCASASCGCAARSAACSRPTPRGCSCAACARCTCAAAPGRERLELARRLAAHPAVRAVHYPGSRHPDHELALRQMPAGAGGVLAFELADGASAGRCEDAVRLVRCATSLGGFETLIECRARVEPEGRVPEGLLRLSVGLEDVDDLWADLAQAIGARRVGPVLRGMLRAMEPDSLLVRGLVDNAVARALPRARPLDDVRARLRAEARPTGAGTRRSPPRPRPFWAPSRTPRRRCSRAA